MKKPDCMVVTGAGAVSPAGVGVDALRDSAAWQAAEDSRTGPFLKVDLALPELARWQKEARLRRASPMSFMLVEAVRQALEQDGGTGGASASTGMVYVSYTGCLTYSCRFYQDLVKNGRRFASPAIFPETVYNSPASHASSVFGIRGACYTLIGDTAAWADALDIASIWLGSGSCERVVVAASEEVDPMLAEAYRAAGWCKRGARVPVAEGAGAVVVRRGPCDGGVRIHEISTGHTFRTKKEAKAAAMRCAGAFPDHVPVYPTAAGTWHERVEADVFAGRRLVRRGVPFCGDAGAAGASWHVLGAAAHLDDSGQILVPIWGLNHQITGVLIG